MALQQGRLIENANKEKKINRAMMKVGDVISHTKEFIFIVMVPLTFPGD
jgi:hypothetical protein